MDSGVGGRLRLATIFSIYADTFLKDQFNPILTNTVTEVDKITVLTGCTASIRSFTTEVSVVDIFRPLLHNTLIAKVANVLEYEQGHHQTYRFGRTALF